MMIKIAISAAFLAVLLVQVRRLKNKCIHIATNRQNVSFSCSCHQHIDADDATATATGSRATATDTTAAAKCPPANCLDGQTSIVSSNGCKICCPQCGVCPNGWISVLLNQGLSSDGTQCVSCCTCQPNCREIVCNRGEIQWPGPDGCPICVACPKCYCRSGQDSQPTDITVVDGKCTVCCHCDNKL